jgi:protein tyrosine phosphatase (PTP) superfamily phosphohydrolase (DUF442 family)
MERVAVAAFSRAEEYTGSMRPAFALTLLLTLLGQGPAPDVRGLHNVHRITDKLLSGSSPDDEEGFRSLRDLGVKTIISVDGARPDAALARRHGMRYVHIPFGYDAIPREQALRLAKAVRDLPGAIYLHCHHGKHRGPAAAAAIRLCLDETCSVEAALAQMQRIGTDPHYTGLYAGVRTLRRPAPAELDRTPADFPETAKVAALAEMMVAIDQRWENLKRVRAAAWTTPAKHPDLDPPHEALQLWEQYQEAGRLAGAKERPPEFRRLLAEAETTAQELAKALRSRPVDHAAAEKLFRRSAAGCAGCHAKYRDVPQAR